ncbi:MAG: CPBP family intramembrane metalloprotease, partial [Verrucomicrobiae bacterium]|nr:CPBP family intramembrane metalloprotease [Verrucomicrobiae bacterium]
MIFLLFGTIVGPFCEEWVFRGFLFGGFAARRHPVAAAIVSSAIFAVAHWYSFFGTIWVFLFGMLMCGIVWKTRTLWPSILIHMIFNGIVFSSLVANY